MAGMGTAEFFVPLLTDTGKARFSPAGQVLVIGGLALLLTTYALINPILEVHALIGNDEGVSSATIEAMEWGRDNTPEEGVFIVLSRPQVKEWAPHILRRAVLNMPFGSEWEPEERKRIARLEELLGHCLDFDCVYSSVVQTMKYDQVYMYVDRDRLIALASMSACVKSSGTASFELMWQNGETAIGRLTSAGADDRGH